MSGARRMFWAAIHWHKAGLISSPAAASVQMTQVILNELVAARELIQEVSRRDPDTGLTGAEFEHWVDKAVAFRVRTQAIEEV